MGMSPMQHTSLGGTGMRTVVSGGTANALVTSSTPAKRVIVKAHNANSNLIYVGISTVATTLDAGNVLTGWHLAADQETPWIHVPGDDLLNVFIDGTTDEDVTFMWDV